MTTNRLYFILFGAPLALLPLLGAVVSGGDLGFVAFLTGIGGGTSAVTLALSVPFIRFLNRWQAAPLAALAPRVGGHVVRSIGGDTHVRVDGREGALVVYYLATAETAGGDEDTPATPWTCVGRLRTPADGPARRAPRGVEVRLLAGGDREVRWLNRWSEVFGRRPPPDPVGMPGARAAEAAVRALAPGVESRLRYEGELVAFAVPGRLTDPERLLALVTDARPHVEAL